MASPTGPAVTPPAPARLWGLLASEANIAVVFRRGPSRWTRLYLWNTKTDTITPGSWFAGRLYEWMSDLSPDGKHMVYVARNESKRRVQAAAEAFDGATMWAWTALCRPPWVRALGLWNASDGWSGGGVFTDNHSFTRNHSAATLRAEIEPAGFDIQGIPGSERLDVVLTALKRTGWHVTQWPDRWRGGGAAKPVVVRKRTLEAQFISTRKWKTYVKYVSHDAGHALLLDGASWADFDQQRRLVFAKEGKLFAVQGAEVQMLADLNLDQPKRRRTPS
ncbi:hypothetical protein [Deinococcus pimensis]|uniref:hypothetical protein n=1 Tax=Deinococcus pimensis TaxID=309888 RepID=UPI0004B6DEDF|nr:hypothetical protein [Deinococcus pimensis]